MNHLIAAGHPAVGHPAPIPYFGAGFAGILVLLILLFSFVIRMRSRDVKGNPTVGLPMTVIFFAIITAVAGIGGNFPQISSLVKSVTQGRLP